jgi:hypothetical protein
MMNWKVVLRKILLNGIPEISILKDHKRKEHAMSNTEDKTLCALQEEGYIQTNTDEFVKLISPANFFCKNCGRSAVSENNLCNPEKLK